LGLYVASCANHSPTVPEEEYSTKIVGRWQGTVGDVKETMSIENDGTFVCRVRPQGFIANTLSQGVTGTVYGTWKITGTLISLRINGAKNERFGSRVASSKIVAFKQDELMLRSDRGETSPFERVRAL